MYDALNTIHLRNSRNGIRGYNTGKIQSQMVIANDRDESSLGSNPELRQSVLNDGAFRTSGLMNYSKGFQGGTSRKNVMNMTNNSVTFKTTTGRFRDHLDKVGKLPSKSMNKDDIHMQLKKMKTFKEQRIKDQKLRSSLIMSNRIHQIGPEFHQKV